MPPGISTRSKWSAWNGPARRLELTGRAVETPQRALRSNPDDLGGMCTLGNAQLARPSILAARGDEEGLRGAAVEAQRVLNAFDFLARLAPELSKMRLNIVHAEPPRYCRRHHLVRGWCHEQTSEVSGRGPGAGSPYGVRARRGLRLPVVGGSLDSRQDRDAYRTDPAQGNRGRKLEPRHPFDVGPLQFPAIAHLGIAGAH